MSWWEQIVAYYAAAQRAEELGRQGEPIPQAPYSPYRRLGKEWTEAEQRRMQRLPPKPNSSEKLPNYVPDWAEGENE